MGRKKPTFNTALEKLENKRNSRQDSKVEFAKENAFDQVNFTDNTSLNNRKLKTKEKDVEFGSDDNSNNNKMSKSRNKKNNRHGNKNRQNENKASS